MRLCFLTIGFTAKSASPTGTPLPHFEQRSVGSRDDTFLTFLSGDRKAQSKVGYCNSSSYSVGHMLMTHCTIPRMHLGNSGWADMRWDSCFLLTLPGWSDRVREG